MKTLVKYKILIVILIIAAILRIPFPDGRSTYAENELYRDLDIVKAMDQGELILTGPQSSLEGFHFGPAYYYLLYPVAKILNFRPYSLAISSLLSSLATIILTFFVLKKWWNDEKLALLTAGIMAVSMFDIQFAKYASNPNFIPLFSLLFFYSLWKILKDQSGYLNALLLGISFGIVTQLHAVPLIALSPLMIFFVIKERKKIKIPQILMALFAALLIYTPYIYYEFTHNFENLRGLFSIASGKTTQSLYGNHIIDYLTFWLSPWININTFFDALSLMSNNLKYFLLSLLILILPVVWLDRVRKTENNLKIITEKNTKKIIIYWLVFPSIIFLLPFAVNRHFEIYYFLILSPLIFLGLGFWFYYLWQKGWSITFYYLLFFYIVLQGTQFVLYHQLVSPLR